MIMKDRRVAALALVGAAFVHGSVAAQQPDTLSAVPLQPVVVTVERSPWPITESAVSVSQLDRADIAAYPQVTLADVLQVAQMLEVLGRVRLAAVRGEAGVGVFVLGFIVCHS